MIHAATEPASKVVTTDDMEVSETLDGIAWSVYDRLTRYHDYRAFGLETFPETGGVLLVSNHSLATYDAFIAGLTVMRRTGRRPRVMADRRLLTTPVLGPYFSGIGFVNGSRESALALLRAGELIGVAPGGMRESIRSSWQRYRIDWTNRLGFVWMSMLSGASIVLSACPAADDIYSIVPNPITPWVYRRFHIPMPIVFGRAGTLIPRPVRLWHVFSEPIEPAPLDLEAPREAQRAEVERHHAYLVDRMKRLMRDALERRNET